MYRIIFQMLFWLGCRVGELLALTSQDIDFENGTVNISKTYYRRNQTDYITPPKTESSNRQITIPKFLAEEMKDFVDRQYGLTPEDRIFPITDRAIQKKMKQKTEQAKLKPIRVHDLRHPYVKPTTKKFASFLKFFRAAAIAARSCSIRYSWLMLPFQISPFLKSPA